MTLLRDVTIQILERARQCEIGLQIRVVTAPNKDLVTPALRGKQILYRFARELGFKNLMFKFHPEDPDHRILILKRTEKDHPKDA